MSGIPDSSGDAGTLSAAAGASWTALGIISVVGTMARFHRRRGFGEKSDWALPLHPPPIRQQISLSENETKVVEQGPHKPPINQAANPLIG